MDQRASVTAATDTPVCLADPHSPWQRPAGESTNRLIREYLPKGTTLTTITATRSRPSRTASTAAPAWS